MRWVLVVAVAMSLLTSGCNAVPQLGGSGQQAVQESATFDRYEVRGLGRPMFPGSPGVSGQIEDVERTGKAYVKLKDGSRVLADCPFPDLKNGAAIRVQQNADGSWVVMGAGGK